MKQFKDVIGEIKNSIIFLLLYNIFFILKRHIYPGEVIFYEAQSILLIQSAAYFFFFYFKKLSIRHIYSSFLLTFLYISLVPTIIDRSVSITVLGSIRVEQNGLTEMEIESKFKQVYLNENEAVKKRLLEQQTSKNIIQNDDKYFLSTKGEIIAQIIELLTKTYNINQSYIMQK